MRCRQALPFTVAKARAWRSSIDDSPAYQRAGDAWSLAQQQRFIDSLLNGYDVPKIYLHDLRGEHPTHVYAIVDGKQRLTAIWSYLADGFPLADTFRVETVPTDMVPPSAVTPAGPLRFSELDRHWQRLLLQTHLAVVLIRDADEDDIDELFARLNDGTPLSPAERRNAIAGDMAALVREVAGDPALAGVLTFADARGSYRDVAAVLLRIEAAASGLLGPGAATDPDVSPAGLDQFVRDHRRLDATTRQALLGNVHRRITALDATLVDGAGRLSSVESAVAAIRALPVKQQVRTARSR